MEIPSKIVATTESPLKSHRNKTKNRSHLLFSHKALKANEVFSIH